MHHEDGLEHASPIIDGLARKNQKKTKNKLLIDELFGHQPLEHFKLGFNYSCVLGLKMVSMVTWLFITFPWQQV